MSKLTKAAAAELRRLRIERVRLETLRELAAQDPDAVGLFEKQERLVASIDEALSLLPPIEYRILHAWYLGNSTHPMADMLEETGYSEPQINRFRYAALRSYAYARALDVRGI